MDRIIKQHPVLFALLDPIHGTSTDLIFHEIQIARMSCIYIYRGHVPAGTYYRNQPFIFSMIVALP